MVVVKETCHFACVKRAEQNLFKLHRTQNKKEV